MYYLDSSNIDFCYLFIVVGTVIQRRDIMDVVCVCQLDTDSFLICYKSMYNCILT